MNQGSNGALLAADEPASFEVSNIPGASPFLLLADHAGNRVPRALGDLGLPESERARHIGWDVGIAALARAVSARLNAPLVLQRYSRLVIDCNRDPAAASAVPEVSDGTRIPANLGLSADDRQARVAAIHTPYQHAIAAQLAARDSRGERSILVALHSFTPSMDGFARPWLAGVLHHRHNDRFAHALLESLRARVPMVGDNEPYKMDGTDYTIPLHAFAAGRPYAEIEIRQDLLGDEAGIARWAGLVAEALAAAADACGLAESREHA